MGEPLRVHCAPALDESARATIEERLGAEPSRVLLSGGSTAPADGCYEVLVSGRPTPELLTASDALHSVVIPWAGVSPLALDALRAHSHLAVYNLHHNAPATAELALGLLLAAAKNIRRFDAELREGDWSGRSNLRRALQLAGRRALVIGYGSVGRRVAAHLRALDVAVTAVSRRGRAAHPDAQEELHSVESLATLLPRAQIVVVCCPATDATDGLLGAEELALLPPDVLLVNVARGRVVDEEALFEALRRRRLFAAGLDVWYRYPTSSGEERKTHPSRLPFHELSNVVLSPHRGGHVRETTDLRMQYLAQTLLRIANGEEPSHRVDLEHGY